MIEHATRWATAALASGMSATALVASCYWYTGSCTRSAGINCGTVTICPTSVSDVMPPWACGWTKINNFQQSMFCQTYKNAIALTCNGPHPGFTRLQLCTVVNEPGASVCCWVPDYQQPELESSSAVVFVLSGDRCGGGCSTTEH
ncbi:MAG: hypothetical protein JNK35_12330 [Phycisphaerae bacterium]|nr:hypothetical protein [Phycisphaerae bacterium]